MALITTNKNTLKKTAIISIKYKKGEVEEKTNGDFTSVWVDGEMVGVNVFNFNKYFTAAEGVHSLNAEQKEVLLNNGLEITNDRKDFSVGEVVEKSIHPKSDRLYLLKVMTDKEIQIVTNAANAEVGKKVVVANVGTILPSGLPIVFSKVMGVESEGMLCGGETLGKEQTEGVLLVQGNNGDEYIL